MLRKISKQDDAKEASEAKNVNDAVALLPPRLPAIDIIRISLTWGILLYHTAWVYAPFGTRFYVKVDGWSNEAFYYLPIAWMRLMDVWQMPMFFFLSGVSAFYALYRRSEKQFREERMHRLLVPYLLLASLNGVYSIAFFAPKTPLCEQFYEHGKVIDNNDLPWDYCEMNYKFTRNDTFPLYLMKHYIGIPIAGQGWFLLYLFFYSQVIPHVFNKEGSLVFRRMVNRLHFEILLMTLQGISPKGLTQRASEGQL